MTAVYLPLLWGSNVPTTLWYCVKCFRHPALCAISAIHPSYPSSLAVPYSTVLYVAWPPLPAKTALFTGPPPFYSSCFCYILYVVYCILFSRRHNTCEVGEGKECSQPVTTLPSSTKVRWTIPCTFLFWRVFLPSYSTVPPDSRVKRESTFSQIFDRFVKPLTSFPSTLPYYTASYSRLFQTTVRYTVLVHVHGVRICAVR